MRCDRHAIRLSVRSGGRIGGRRNSRHVAERRGLCRGDLTERGRGIRGRTVRRATADRDTDPDGRADGTIEPEVNTGADADAPSRHLAAAEQWSGRRHRELRLHAVEHHGPGRHASDVDESPTRHPAHGHGRRRLLRERPALDRGLVLARVHDRGNVLVPLQHPP
jgi:hypothetical protein